MNQETKVLIAIGLVTTLLIGGGVFLFSKNQSSPQTSSTQVVDKDQLVKGASITRGDPNSQVVIVEWGDFQCPACAQAAPILEKVLQDYGDKIQVVYRHYPLPQHAHARKSAEAAESANDQGKFWEMYTKLYATQSEWTNLSADKAAEKFRQYATELGLDMNKFNDSFNNNKHSEKIQNDLIDGNALGVNSTPTFYFNNQKQLTIPSYNQFKAMIDAALSSNSNSTNSAN